VAQAHAGQHALQPTVQPTAQPAVQLGLDELGTPLIDTTFVVLDLETTGLSPERDRITEVGAVKVRGGEVLGELQTFVHPGCPIPPGITAITGITDAMVRDAPTIDVVVPTILRFLDGATFVAHNAGFDLGFLRAAAERHGHPRPDPLVVDTARLSRRLLREELRDHRLATVANHLRARVRPDHRALTDARATVDVLHGLIERAGSLGATTLEDLRELARSTSDRSFRRIALVRDAPRAPGVYRFLDERGETLYVGKATDLRSRLRSYFGQDRRRRTAELVRETHRVTWTVTTSLLEAEVRELRTIQAQQPRYNRRSTRPTPQVYVALTAEPFPRLVVTRSPSGAHRPVLGPPLPRRIGDRLVAALQELTAIRPCTPRLRVAQDHGACVLKELGHCGAPCDGSQSREAYGHVVTEVERLLADTGALLPALRARMDEHARQGRFERATEARTQLHSIARAVEAAHRAAGLGAADRLLARRCAREPTEHTEVAVIERGRLVSVARVPTEVPDAQLETWLSVHPPTVLPEPVAQRAREEQDLVASWLGRTDVRLVRVEGTYAQPWQGGQTIAATAAESRRVDRQVRHDRQVLTRTKVARRG
jgi:DNA polymerase III subunit epsilon